MEYKDYTVTFTLNTEQIEQLNRITKLFNNIANDGTTPATPEFIFSSIMQMGSRRRIQEAFDFFEDNFTANQPQNKTD